MDLSQGCVEDPPYSEAKRERMFLELQSKHTGKSPDSKIQEGKILRFILLWTLLHLG